MASAQARWRGAGAANMSAAIEALRLYTSALAGRQLARLPSAPSASPVLVLRVHQRHVVKARIHFRVLERRSDAELADPVLERRRDPGGHVAAIAVGRARRRVLDLARQLDRDLAGQAAPPEEILERVGQGRDLVLRRVEHLAGDEQDLLRGQEALTLAREFSHPTTLAHAQLFTGLFHQFRREGPETQELAEALIGLAAGQGLPTYLGGVSVLRGWALAEGGHGE